MTRYSGGYRHSLASVVKSTGGRLYESEIRASWRSSGDEIRIAQYSRIRRSYEFARRWVPFYQSQPDLYPPSPRNLEELPGFLDRLPRLSKDILRANNVQFRPPAWRLPTTVHSTSGTTGTPLQIYATLAERFVTEAVLQSWYRRVLSTRSRPRVIGLSGFVKGLSDPIVRAAHRNDYFINIYQIAPRYASQYSALLETQEPTVIAGYASSIAELARAMGPLSLEARKSTLVVPTSEVCTEPYRDAIRDRISSLVLGQYGSQEGCHLALECAEGGRYHSHSLFGMVRLEPRFDSPGLCDVLVTSSRRGMMLVNYELGDLARPAEGRCACGSGEAGLEDVLGRSEDLVVTPDGRRIGYLLFHSTKSLPSIREGQLIQQGFADFLVRIVDAGPNGERRFNESQIRREIEERLGYKVNVTFDYVQRIERYGERGKFKAVIVDFGDDA